MCWGLVISDQFGSVNKIIWSRRILKKFIIFYRLIRAYYCWADLRRIVINRICFSRRLTSRNGHSCVEPDKSLEYLFCQWVGRSWTCTRFVSCRAMVYIFLFFTQPFGEWIVWVSHWRSGSCWVNANLLGRVVESLMFLVVMEVGLLLHSFVSHVGLVKNYIFSPKKRINFSTSK